VKVPSPDSSSGESPPANQPGGDSGGRLITCSVADLHPHPSFIRRGLVPTARELLALAMRGDLAYREPLAITQDYAILVGYG
jgi:hypothetical protein